MNQTKNTLAQVERLQIQNLHIQRSRIQASQAQVYRSLIRTVLFMLVIAFSLFHSLLQAYA